MTRRLHYADSRELGIEARRFVEFDIGSIEQLVTTDRGADPEVWLVDPGGYEENGHPSRDSESIRLIAYSTTTHTVYATDGCNVCRHALLEGLDAYNDPELAVLSRNTQLPLEMLRRAAALSRED